MKMNFHIERLIIEGSSRVDALRVADVLRGQLSELAAARPVVRPARMARVDGGVLPHTASPDQIGGHIAGQIFANLRGRRHA